MKSPLFYLNAVVPNPHPPPTLHDHFILIAKPTYQRVRIRILAITLLGSLHNPFLASPGSSASLIDPYLAANPEYSILSYSGAFVAVLSEKWSFKKYIE